MIVSQNTKLNVVPGGIIPVVNVSQYDVNRSISFTLYDGNGAAELESGTAVSIEGTKPDGHGFQYEGTLADNVATFNTTQQMTVLVGAIECKLTLRKGSQVIGTAMFILDVEKAGINEDTVISDTDIPMIISLATEQMERAEAAADSASESAIVSGSAMRIAGESAAICASILPVVRGYKESAEQSAVVSGSYMRVAGESAEDAEYWARYAEAHAGTGHIIVDKNGTVMAQREKLKFLNSNVTDDLANNQTIVSPTGSGSGGSNITIITSETTLRGKTVTVSGTSETKTTTIDANGKAEIDGFMETGTITVSASDGTETATRTVSIPYFGNYAVTLSFWAATLSISTDSPALYGQTVTVKDANNQTVATATMSAQGACSATVSATGTYTVSAVGDGVTVSESVSVSAQTTYNVSLHLWTATVSISTTSSELYGQTITVKKGGSTVGTTTFSAQGSASYSAHDTGEYTFECTYSGQTYSDSVTVSAETSYTATINTNITVTVTLYSAAADTVSFTDLTGAKTAVTDNTGKAENVSITVEPNSTSVTFTSSVAKDPDNLSNDYTKAVSITSGMTAIYVMPVDDCLYWYGYKSANLEDVTLANGYDRSDYTYRAPTYNTNNYYYTTSSQDFSISCAANKNAISGTTAYYIVKGTAALSGTYGGLYANTIKGITGMNYDTILNTSSMVKMSKDISNFSYIMAGGLNTRSGYVYALWYE